MQPLVSVIIPNYNHAPYLRERIDSVLQQTYPNVEVILLDDCSADNSREIIESYREHPRVAHIVMGESNSGSTFVQWQKGFDLAQGEYIWIAESDDRATPDFLDKLVGKATAHGAVLAFCRSTFIDSQGEVLPQYHWDSPRYYKNGGVYDGRQYAHDCLLYNNKLYNASMIVFRKDALRHVSPDYRRFRYCGDWYFWFDVCCQGTIVEVPEALNFFRQHPQKVSVTSEAAGLQFEEGAQCQMHFIHALHLSSLERRCLRGRMTKRLLKSNPAKKNALIAAFPALYAASWVDRLMYACRKVRG